MKFLTQFKFDSKRYVQAENFTMNNFHVLQPSKWIIFLVEELDLEIAILSPEQVNVIIWSTKIRMF